MAVGSTDHKETKSQMLLLQEGRTYSEGMFSLLNASEGETIEATPKTKTYLGVKKGWKVLGGLHISEGECRAKMVL